MGYNLAIDIAEETGRGHWFKSRTGHGWAPSMARRQRPGLCRCGPPGARRASPAAGCVTKSWPRNRPTCLLRIGVQLAVKAAATRC